VLLTPVPVPRRAVHHVAARGAITMTTVVPLQRTMVAVDAEASTNLNNTQKARLRKDMYDHFEQALLSCGVTEDPKEPFLDRGDGILALIRPADEIPKPLLISKFVPALRRQLVNPAPDRRFRLRVAVHAGDVHYDGRGHFGEDLDVTFRLLNAPEFKEQLAGSTEPLALVVSDQMYRSAVRHGYEGIDVSTFQPLVCVWVGGHAYRGWVQVTPEAGL
jgi:class 3 adenylate cyclase